jgi:DNA-binding NarL/FixJ family response regulator
VVRLSAGRGADAQVPMIEAVRVFIVEDQPALLKGLLKSLSTFSELEIVGTAQDGELAVDEVTKVKPQLLLLDLELPSLGGIEVTRKLKGRLPELEILILTSFDDEQKVYQAMVAGASGYLVKRVGPEKIRSSIQDVMAGGTVLEAQIAKRFWNYFQSVKAGAGPRADPWGLTEVEREILTLVGKGLSNAEVGQALELKRRTVRTHLKHLYGKMGVRSHVDAVVLALKHGLVDL